MRRIWTPVWKDYVYVCHELTKKRKFALKSQNMKEAIDIEVTLTLETKLQKYVGHF